LRGILARTALLLRTSGALHQRIDSQGLFIPTYSLSILTPPDRFDVSHPPSILSLPFTERRRNLYGVPCLELPFFRSYLSTCSSSQASARPMKKDSPLLHKYLFGTFRASYREAPSYRFRVFCEGRLFLLLSFCTSFGVLNR